MGHITQLFQLGRLGVRSHNFCEVPTSGGGVPVRQRPLVKEPKFPNLVAFLGIAFLECFWGLLALSPGRSARRRVRATEAI